MRGYIFISLLLRNPWKTLTLFLCFSHSSYLALVYLCSSSSTHILLLSVSVALNLVAAPQQVEILTVVNIDGVLFTDY